MCGIVGFINCGNQTELREAVSIIKHRGPDHQAIKWFEKLNSGLGHARLSIIDLSPSANQPMDNAQSGNWIIFNGEIYNHKEIRNELITHGYAFNSESDTEVILKAYHKWDEKCLNRFNGMFAFAIFNENTGNVFIARDRLGIKPLYYYHNKYILIFASEIKAILECKDYKKEADFYSLHTPVHFQIGPYTGFKNIYKLKPGCFLKFNDGEVKITRYWNLNPEENGIEEKEAIRRLDYFLNDSISLNMVSDVPIGVLLSGGLDSSIISVLMQNKIDHPINSFTIKFKEKDLKLQGSVNDAEYAKRLAEKCGFNHKEIEIEPDIIDLLPKIIWHLDEPIADPAAINTFLISKAARQAGIKVLLNGMGGDEVFSGYRAHLACLKAENYQKLLPNIFRKQIEKFFRNLPESGLKHNYKHIRWLKRFLEIGSLPQFERSIAIKNSALTNKTFNYYYLSNEYNYLDSYYYRKNKNLFLEHPDISYLTKICLADTLIYLPDHNLTYSDKASMAAGVEGRPPLIDHRIVEFMFSLPPKFRIQHNIQKYLLKKVSEKYLPKEIICRSKAPFSAPMRAWLKNELKEMVNDILSYDSIKHRGIYNPEYVQKLIKMNEKGLQDNSQLIWRLMVNEIWFKTFFDK